MASVSATSTSSLNLQMEDVAEKLFTHINLTSEELQIFNLKTMPLDGKYYRVDFQTEGNAYMASRAPGAYQPGYDPSAAAEDGFADYSVGEMLFRPRHTYISTDFTGQMKAAVKSRKGGYFNLAEFRFKDTAEQIKERVAIKLAGTQLGTLGRIQSVAGSPTIVMRYAGYNATGPAVLGFDNGVRHIKRGMRLDAAAATRAGALRSGANDRGRWVTAVEMDVGDNTTGPAITLNSAPTSWAAGDYVVMYNERQAAAISSSSDWASGVYSPLGIIDAVDDGTVTPYYGELARASYPTLKAQVFSNSGVLRPLTQQLINFAIDRKKQISGGNPDVLYSTFGVQRYFVDFLTIQGSGGSGATSSNNPMRFNQPGAKQKIGFNEYEVYPLGVNGSLTFMPSRHAPHHTAFILQRDSAILLQDGPPSFIDYDGQTIRKVVGKDEATADWVWRATGIVCREPWKNIRIDDLSGDHTTA